MKAQRKEVSTSQTHITVRLKKGGSGKGTNRFEVLINRSAYPSDANPKTLKNHKWNMAEVVQEVFTNAAKLEPADKALLNQTFGEKSKEEIIHEVLERGEAQLSEHDRSEQTVKEHEYYTSVAAAVASSALLYPTSTKDAAAADGGAAASAAGGKKKERHEKKKGGDDASSLTGTGGGPRLTKVEADIVEREMKNIRHKIHGSSSSMDEEVNFAFAALAKKSDLGMFRDQKIWVIDSKKASEAQEVLSAIADISGRKPFKLLKTVNDKSGGAQLTVLVDGSLKQPSSYSKQIPATCEVLSSNQTHVPTGDEDNLALVVPAAAATKVVASKPAPKQAPPAAAAAAASGDNDAAGEDNNNNGKKGGKKDKKGGKKEQPAGKGGKGGAAGAPKAGSLEAELAGLKIPKGSDSESDESEDDMPKMQVKKKKR